MKNNEFENAYYKNCPIHKKEKMLFFRKCWKCEVVSRAKTISEAKLLINFKKYLK